ncbi:hypothetical protein LLG88_13480 [bacterium]|nr:hypothetical protein [bacterium]
MTTAAPTSNISHAELERLRADVAFWKGKAQLWAAQVADVKLKNRRLAGIIRRLRAKRSAAR